MKGKKRIFVAEKGELSNCHIFELPHQTLWERKLPEENSSEKGI